MAAAAAATAAGLPGRRYKNAPQTRRTSLDQPPPPTPPPVAPLRPVGSASSAQPRGPGRRLGGVQPGSPLAGAARPAAARGRTLQPDGQTRKRCPHPGVKFTLSTLPAARPRVSPTSHLTPRLFKETFLPLGPESLVTWLKARMLETARPVGVVLTVTDAPARLHLQ